MELGAQNQKKDGLSGPNSKMVVHVDPLGNIARSCMMKPECAADGVV